jgi:predicted DNA-binding WGR domain protein
MGGFTVYDMLIGNPSLVIEIEKSKKYDWMRKVRVVYKDGNVSNKTGIYNGEGKVIFKDGGFFTSEEGDYVVDKYSDNIYDYKGYIILDKTYKMLKNHKLFSCIKSKNLFDLLEKFYKLNDKNMFYGIGNQYIYIDEIEKNKIWQLENPDKNKKNKDRIEKIINNFYNFACKNNDNKKINNDKINNDKKLITKYYELIDNSSSKFWKISYKDGYYKITYGKIGSKGITKEKKDSLKNILKVIKSKVDKGYKLK